MDRVECFNKTCVNLIKIYQDNTVVSLKASYIEIVCGPRICIKQRLGKLSNDASKIRIIIKVYNYEKFCFENVFISSELIPQPKKIIINKIDGAWIYDRQKLIVNIPNLKALSKYSIDYLGCYYDALVINSIVELMNLEGHKNKALVSKIKI